MVCLFSKETPGNALSWTTPHRLLSLGIPTPPLLCRSVTFPTMVKENVDWDSSCSSSFTTEPGEDAAGPGGERNWKGNLKPHTGLLRAFQNALHHPVTLVNHSLQRLAASSDISTALIVMDTLLLPPSHDDTRNIPSLELLTLLSSLTLVLVEVSFGKKCVPKIHSSRILAS